MAGFSSQEPGAPLSEINITPLVDVMLVLLVIFMVSAPMMESGIAIRLPKAATKALPQEDKPATLSITKDSRFYLNKEEVQPSQLGTRLKEYFKHSKRQEVFIRAADELQYQVVVSAMSAVKSAGIDRIGLVTMPAGVADSPASKKHGKRKR